MRVYTEDELDWDDETTSILCPYCEQRGYKNVLGPKILGPQEPRPDDYENFLQCAVCYEIIPLHETYQDATISDVIEKSENPFEQGKFYMESIPKRSSVAGKKLSAKKRQKKIKLDEDPEIDALLKAYGDNVNVLK